MTLGRRLGALSESEDNDFEEKRIISDDEPSEEFEEDLRKVKSNTESGSESGSDKEEVRRRSRKRVNYNEDALLPPIDGDEEEEEEEEKLRLNSKRRRVARDDDDDDFNANVNNNNDNDDDDDDEFLADDDDDDDDDFLKPKIRRPKGFIVKDDFEEEDNEFRIGKSKRSKRLRRHFNDEDENDDEDEDGDDDDTNNNINNKSDEEPLTLDQELEELKNDSPLNSPKRNLRKRNDVNYTLPSPYLTEAQMNSLATNIENNFSPKKGRNGRFGGLPSQSNNQLRRLFPTVGPFGGSDITSIFQQNTFINGNTPTIIGNVDSSDSDDDELIKPTNPNDLSNVITTALVNDPTSTSTTTKNKNTLADTDPLGIDTNIDFSAIGGLDNYINQLKEMITLPLLYPEIYSKFHITPPRGVLFHGPPGTGKTLMARALAASCSSQDKKITFFMRKGADCLSKWVGEAERHLRLLFEEAKQNQPSIIFFDEIDGLAPVRSSKQEQIHASIVSTLLALMDGMDNRGQVIIIGATNRPDSIDPALRRPGRFDREFYFPLPDLNARKEILNIQMNKWDYKLDDNFINELAKLTKGYGGADLKALCTESALNCIQRSYPQIYKSNDKLKLKLSNIKVESSDFTRALKKIIPNSARSTSNVSEPLPNKIEPLLNSQFNQILNKIKNILPIEKEITLLEESQFVNLNKNFSSQQFVKELDYQRVFNPRFAINGNFNQGINYLSNAILNKLEGFTIQILDLSKLFSDSSVSIENLCIQMFAELKRHRPSILFVPDLIGFLSTISESCKNTVRYLIRGIKNNEKILIFCEIEGVLNEEILYELEYLFGIEKDDIFKIRNPNLNEIELFFNNTWESIKLKPIEFNDLSIRPKRNLKKLKVIKQDNEKNCSSNSKVDKKISVKEQNKLDMKLKNTLKIKLSGLMELFKNRYKRFKKPAIDDSFLVHLFEPENDPNAIFNYQIDKDSDMIVELTSGKKFYNIDLDVIEERLWNGFYSEPKQFLFDLEMILKDAITVGDRERILKANEMYAHAMVGVEEIETQFPILMKDWKNLRLREKTKIKQFQQQSKNLGEGESVPLGLELAPIVNDVENHINGSADENGNNKAKDAQVEVQTQVQAQIQPAQTAIDSPSIPVEPVVLTEPIEKIHIEKEVEKEIERESPTEQTQQLKASVQTQNDATGSSTNGTGSDPDANHQQLESESESESEIEPELDSAIQTIKYDETKLESLKISLVEKVEGKSLSELERINSKLVKIIWDHRLQSDKVQLLSELEEFIRNLN
ncbi:hypothetical protein DAMA08_044130 [Martiniozyma asiatica (nom. inval.)]|nr:hypothetical protein DAMA08_044130 [Martiniozyma asiatica]